MRRFRGSCVFTVLGFFLIGAWGCSIAPEVTGLKSGSTDVEYTPPPKSSAFRQLRLEKLDSVVILAVNGDDIQGNMHKIHRIMLDKGYAVRDTADTLMTLKRANLIGKKSSSPEVLKRAAELFKEQVAIAGRVELIQAEPARVVVVLHLIELKNQKTLWTVKTSYVGRYFGVPNPYERAVQESVEKSLSVLPQAKP